MIITKKYKISSDDNEHKNIKIYRFYKANLIENAN